MLDDEHGAAGLVPDPPQQRPQRLGLALRDAARRLVEDQHGRLVRDRHREIHDAPRAGRELGDELVPERAEAHQLDQVVDRERDVGLRLAHRRCREKRRDVVAHFDVPFEPERDVLRDRQRREDLRVLEGAAETDRCATLGGPLGDIGLTDEDVATLRRQVTGDDVEDRGLAGAVGADETQDLALVHGERHVVNRGDTAEVVAQVADGERGRPGDRLGFLAHPLGLRLGVTERLRRAVEEHRAQHVVALEQLLGRAGESHLALLHEIGARRDRECDVDRLLDQHDGGALRMDRANGFEQPLNDDRREAE